MKDYSKVFTDGYVSGSVHDFNINYSEFSLMCDEVRNKVKDKEKNFQGVDSRTLKNYTLKKEQPSYIYDYFRSLTLQIMEKIAPEYNIIPTEKGHFGDLLNLMDEGCFATPHHDGDVGDMTMLIYLSDPSSYNGSGKLVLMNKVKGQIPKRMNVETCDPIEGNIFMLETVVHNPVHMVESVEGDFKRLAYVARIKKG